MIEFFTIWVLHQAQDLGAEVVVAVAPADAAARHPAAAQVNPLEQPRVHVDLEQRPRRHHALDLRHSTLMLSTGRSGRW